jgi:hypothetical protein
MKAEHERGRSGRSCSSDSDLLRGGPICTTQQHNPTPARASPVEAVHDPGSGFGFLEAAAPSRSSPARFSP